MRRSAPMERKGAPFMQGVLAGVVVGRTGCLGTGNRNS